MKIGRTFRGSHNHSQEGENGKECDLHFSFPFYFLFEGRYVLEERRRLIRAKSRVGPATKKSCLAV